MEHHAVSIAQALDVRCQVEADCPMANGIHGLSIKKVMRSGWTSIKKRRELSSACAKKSRECVCVCLCVVFAARTKGAPVLVLQLPPLQTGLGWRLLLHPALAGNPGGALGAEVCGDVPGEPPLGSKRSVATSHHTLGRKKTIK